MKKFSFTYLKVLFLFFVGYIALFFILMLLTLFGLPNLWIFLTDIGVWVHYILHLDTVAIAIFVVILIANAVTSVKNKAFDKNFYNSCVLGFLGDLFLCAIFEYIIRVTMGV